MQQEECFHIGVKALISNSEGKVLLLEKRPTSRLKQSWDIPGGRMQQGETFEAALCREVYEETGLQSLSDISFLTMVMTETRIPVPHGEVALVLALYQCTLLIPEPVTISHEHLRFDWFERTSLGPLLAPFFPSELIAHLN